MIINKKLTSIKVIFASNTIGLEFCIKPSKEDLERCIVVLKERYDIDPSLLILYANPNCVSFLDNIEWIINDVINYRCGEFVLSTGEKINIIASGQHLFGSGIEIEYFPKKVKDALLKHYKYDRDILFDDKGW